MKIFSRKSQLFSFLLITSFLFYSFIQGTVWLDENHDKTSQTKAKYYRPTPKKKRSGYLIVDYYKSGQKYREGKAESTIPNKENFKGILTYYYEKGTVLKKEKYRDGEIFGLYQEYYPTGELKVDGSYENGMREGVWKIYHKTGKIKSKGKYREGEKVGVWKTYYKNVYYPDNE